MYIKNMNYIKYTIGIPILLTITLLIIASCAAISLGYIVPLVEIIIAGESDFIKDINDSELCVLSNILALWRPIPL